MAENNENFILEQAGSSGERLRGILGGSPRLRALVDRLSPEDAKTLGSILSDPEKIKSVLSSPQARELMKQQRAQSGVAGEKPPKKS